MSGVTNNTLHGISISASNGAPDVYGSMMMENIWQVNGEEEMPCSICCLGCESANSLEENHGHVLSIEVSMIFEWETL